MKYITALFVFAFLFPSVTFAQSTLIQNVNCVLPDGSEIIISRGDCQSRGGYEEGSPSVGQNSNTSSQQGVQLLIVNTTQFVLGTLVPFLFGLAFLFFVINVFRYFILGGSNEEGQKKAKALAIYGVAAFVFLIAFYGIVNLLVDSTGLGGEAPSRPDYIEKWCERQYSSGPPTADVQRICGS